MATNYDHTDLHWSWNGDFQIGKDGDFSDTFADQIQSLVQEIQTVTASAIGDWLEHPSYAAGLDDFVGEANTRATSEKIRSRVIDALVVNNIVKQGDLNVRVIPAGPHTVMVMIRVNAQPTANNSLEQNAIVINLVFDYQERGIFFIEG